MAKVRKIEVREATFDIDGETVSAVVVPIAAPAIQVVIGDELGEIMSVAYIDSDGEITWKFNEPKGEFKKAIERKLKETFLENTEKIEQPVLKCYRKVAVRTGSLITFDEEGKLIGFPILADGTVSLKEKFEVEITDGLEDLLQQ